MTPESPEEQQESTLERKPYSPPRIEESGRFEHLTLACAMDAGGVPPECLIPGPTGSVM